ncbi:hypothetical protein GOP47_0026253 [Adiantum capillus-veneris]|nr:hypothetical protein GOP47_0026253 [Adiantum capillus-veneris]
MRCATRLLSLLHESSAAAWSWMQLLRGMKLAHAAAVCQVARAPRSQAHSIFCSASVVPNSSHTSFAPLLAHPFKSFVTSGAYLCKELLDGNWKSYLVSLVPVGISVGISCQLCIGLEYEIQVAVLRSFAQMLTLGLILKSLCGKNAIWSFLGIILMVFLAGTTAGEQAKELPKSQAVATISLIIGTLGTMALMVLLQVLPSESTSLIAITGHILGNAMIMVGRTLKALQQDIAQHAGQVEAALALGATPYRSVQSYIRQAFLNGMAPMIDAIKVMGLVSLPGNMTGLLLGGAAPVEAVVAQIKLVNAVFAAAAISCLIATLLGWHMLFTPYHQLQK